MRFFEAQRLARRNSVLLLVLFTVGVICLSALNAVIIAASLHTQRFFIQSFIASAIFFIIISIVYSIRYSAGSKVARLMGGSELSISSNDPNEKRLINIVQEMSIASGSPIPRVFVLKGETCLNAFAAGVDFKDCAIVVTQGALDNWNRDQLQAVIGHEFSHILNEDMRLNMHIAGVVAGFQLLMKAGDAMTSRSHRSISRSSKDATPLIGFGFLSVGFLGNIFSRIIQAAVSREREYLADASSAQFTRNPSALAEALAKIVACGGSSLQTPARYDFAHAFFADSFASRFLSLTNTHPSITDRIQRLVPNGSVEDFIEKAMKDSDHIENNPTPRELQRRDTATGARLTASAGQLSLEGIMGAGAIIATADNWSPALKNLELAKSALALVTFHSQSNYAEAKQLIREQVFQKIEFDLLQQQVDKSDRDRIAVFQLVLASLKNATLEEKKILIQQMHATFASDQNWTLLESFLFIVAEQILLPAQSVNKKFTKKFVNRGQALQELKDILQNKKPWVVDEVKAALMTLSNSSLLEKKRILEELESVYKFDKQSRVEEYRLLALAIKVPIPTVASDILPA